MMGESSERADTPSSIGGDSSTAGSGVPLWLSSGASGVGSDVVVGTAYTDAFFEDFHFDEDDPNPIGVLKARLDWNVLADGGWSCQQCTFENERGRVKCTCCGYARYAPTPPPNDHAHSHSHPGSDQEDDREAPEGEQKQRGDDEDDSKEGAGLPSHLDTVESSSDEETRARRAHPRARRSRSPFQANPALLKFGSISGPEPYIPRQKSTLDEADERDKRRERQLAIHAADLRREKRRAEGLATESEEESDDSDHVDWSDEDEAKDNSDDSEYADDAGAKPTRPTTKPRSSGVAGAGAVGGGGAGSGRRRASPSDRPSSAARPTTSSNRDSSLPRATHGKVSMDVDSDDADEMADFIVDDVGEQGKDKKRRRRRRRTHAVDGDPTAVRRRRAASRTHVASDIVRPSSRTAAILRAGGSAFSTFVPTTRANVSRPPPPSKGPQAVAATRAPHGGSSSGVVASGGIMAGPAQPQPYITPTLSRPAAVPSAPHLAAPDMHIRLLRLKLPQVAGLSSAAAAGGATTAMPTGRSLREWIFRIVPKSDAAIASGADPSAPSSSRAVGCSIESLAADLTLAHLLARVRALVLAHTGGGVRIQMEWVCTRAGADQIPMDTRLGELFGHQQQQQPQPPQPQPPPQQRDQPMHLLDDLHMSWSQPSVHPAPQPPHPPQKSPYQLHLSNFTQLQRVTLHTPPACLGQTSTQKQVVHQRVRFQVSRVQVEFVSVESDTPSIREKYVQIGKARTMTVEQQQVEAEAKPETGCHPYLLELLGGGGGGGGRGGARKEEVVTEIRLTRHASHLSPGALQPFLLALEADAGGLQTLALSTPALDDSCGRILLHLTQPLTRHQLSGLTSISFAGTGSISPSVWQRLLPPMGQLALAHLDLSGTSVGDACLPALHQLLTSPRASKALRSLHLSDCLRLTGGFEEEAVAAVLTTSAPGVVHFSFDRTPLTPGCLVHLLHSLEDRDDLQTLSLVDMPMMRRFVPNSVRLEEEQPPLASRFAGAAVATVNAMRDLVEVSSLVVGGGGGDDGRPLMVCLEDYKYFKPSSVPLDAPEPELTPPQQEILCALVEFATATMSTPTSQEATKHQVKVDLTDWLPTSNCCMSDHLFPALHQILTSDCCRAVEITMRGVRLTPFQQQHLAAIPAHQRAKLVVAQE